MYPLWVVLPATLSPLAANRTQGNKEKNNRSHAGICRSDIFGKVKHIVLEQAVCNYGGGGGGGL